MTGLSRTPALLLAAGAYTAGSVAGAALGGPWWLTALLASLLGAAVLLRDGGTRWLVVLAAVCAASAGHARIEASERSHRLRSPPPEACTRWSVSPATTQSPPAPAFASTWTWSPSTAHRPRADCA